MTVRLLTLAIFAAPLFAQAPGPRDAAARIIGHQVVESRAFEKLRHLTDRIGHRLSGSPQLEQAVAWAQAEFRRDGLTNVRAEEVQVPKWVRGVERCEIVAPANHRLALLALGGSVPTPAGGLTAEVVEVRTFEELERLGEAAVRGKIVLYGQAMVRSGEDGPGYGTVASLRTRGAVAAAKLGAVGALIRSLGTASFRLPHTGATHYEEGVAQLPFAALAAEDAELIHRLLEQGPVKVRLELGCSTGPDVPSANVVAELPGREKPEEIVLIGAHLDSWDVGTGAHDDGAGCAHVMDTMRTLVALGLKPRRTIRAVLFTNEENGLRGGRDYFERHKDELERHVAALETDSGGFRPQGFGWTAGEGADRLLRELVAPLRAIGADGLRVGGGGADISPLARARVPLLGLRVEGTRYFDYHHTEADTLDKVDPTELAQGTAALAVLTWGLAEHAETLPRPPLRAEDAEAQGQRRRPER